jgi:glycine betaine/choline ABC-type transport system substrate-binding protein
MIAVCGCSSGPRRIVVGSKNFTEQIVLGEIIAQQIERQTGAPVDRKLNLGGTLLAHEALVNGGIDLYPEYTGTALTAVLKGKPEGDPAQVLERVRAEYERRWQLRWLPPLGFDDTFAMVVRGDTARKRNLKTLSDAAGRGPWKLGVGYEFVRRPDGLDGLLRTYQLKLDGPPVTMDLGLLYRALTSRQVDMIAANATDGQLSTLDVKMLRDDRSYFPPYQCAVVVRTQSLRDHPSLEHALLGLSGKITDEVMRKLNHEAQSKQASIEEIARQFVRSIHGSPVKR